MFCTRIGTMQMRNNSPSDAAVAKHPDADAEIPGYEGLPPAFVRCFPEQLRAAGQSFFAVFNHTGTHESQAFPEAERSPQAVKPEEVPLPPFYPDTPAVREAMARTYDNIARMDGWVGERHGNGLTIDVVTPAKPNGPSSPRSTSAASAPCRTPGHDKAARQHGVNTGLECAVFTGTISS